MAEETGGAAAADFKAAPLPHRRPRVREVSSRFMSPLIHSNSTTNPSDLRSKSAHRRQPTQTDENLILDPILSTVQRKQQQQRVKQHHHHSVARFSSRPDTPIAIGTDRIVPSRYRQVPSTSHRSHSMNSSSSSCTSVTAAARLLLEATSDVENNLARVSTSSRDDLDTCSTSCPNSPICVQNNKLRSVPDVRRSMSDMDKWLTEKKNCDKIEKVTGDCARSLNFSSSVRMAGGISRPPHPSSCVRSGLDVKKGRKVSNHQEDVHNLKMLNNNYMQWRFANAKAEACIRAQKQEAERKLYSLGVGGKLSDIRADVRKKRTELAVLRGIKNLTTIVEAQIPYLDDWSTLEEGYSDCLTGTTNALLSSSVRVPVSGEVRADTGELTKALSSALKVVELISSHIQRFIPKAEEMNISISELARMAAGERARIQECGDLLSKTYSSQVKEYSLRVTQMQSHYSNHHHSLKSIATS